MTLLAKYSAPLLALLGTISASDCRPSVQWGPCPETELYASATFPIECGNLSVPLDYSSPNSSETYTLQLLKVVATKQPAKGSIQINYGGPGNPVIPSLVNRTQEMLALSGGEYNIIGFDPRGTDSELPFICTNDTFSMGRYLAWQVDTSEAQNIAKKAWATTGVVTGICKSQGNGDQVGDLLGTAFVARDMARVAEAVDEDGLIRFWGLSYGTLLGATIAAMFPDRVDRMVIDGVLNPHEYYNALADFQQWTDIDKTLTYFYESCVEAGPDFCPIAALNKTTEELEKDTWAWLDSLKEDPLALPASNTLFDAFTAKGLFFSAFYRTPLWPALAQLLVPAIWGSAEEQLEALETYHLALVAGPGGEPVAPTLNPIDKFLAIHCSDRVVRASTYDEIEPAFEKLFDISKIQGGAHALTASICAQWPWRAKESFTGSFDVKTKQPVFLMGTTYDSQTAIAGAHNVSASFEGSAILEVEGAGHCAYSLPSACTAKYLQDYWVNGKLPEPDTKCKPDAGAWEPSSWIETIEKLSDEAKD